MVPVSERHGHQEQSCGSNRAGSGIGQAVAIELAKNSVGALALVDLHDSVREAVASINDGAGKTLAQPFIGDVTDAAFRRSVFDGIQQKSGDLVRICVPAAGITRDGLAVHIDKTLGKAVIYPEETFQKVIDVDLKAPAYWVLEMTARIADDRYRRGLGRWHGKLEDVTGTSVFIGSVSSLGNKGQMAYAAAKRGLQGISASLMDETMFFGVRCAVIHPGFTDTPMVRALPQEFIEKHILPQTQLERLIRPEEVARAVCFMIGDSAVGGELWCDAGWHPSAQ
jgi:NAD(P)-dependent dehydrogenase (short-subunit alcohol dehydrogenase family)